MLIGGRLFDLGIFDLLEYEESYYSFERPTSDHVRVIHR
jgi:hypothetical protein